MTQERVTETHALARPLDKTGYIRHYKRLFIVLYHAQNRSYGGEMIVRDLRLRRAHNADKAGFAHIRKSHKPYVRQKLQLQRDIKLLAGISGLCKTRYLAGRRRKVHIALAALAALCDNHRLVIGYIREYASRFAVLDYRAARNFYNRVGRGLAGASP